MIPYKWEETKEAYLAIVQPKERFVENSIFESARHEYEFILSGILKDDGERDTFCFGYEKEVFDKKTAERYNSWVNDDFSWNPEEEQNAKEIIIPSQERKAA